MNLSMITACVSEPGSLYTAKRLAERFPGVIDWKTKDMFNPISAAKDRPHRWQFFRSGGFDQVRLETGADLMALDQLDQKLWAALSCPTHRLEFDERTLRLIDGTATARFALRSLSGQ